MIRYKAFAIHLAISAAVIAVITGLFIWLWFPLPYFLTEGGWRGVRLIAAVEFIIGPLITLIIYNPKKPRGKLLFDLIVIALMQILALGGGLLTVSSKRIVATVYSDGTLYPLDANTAMEIGGKLTGLIASSKTTPAYVVVDLPDGLKERQKMRLAALSGGKPLTSHDELMIPLDESARGELNLDDVAPLGMPYLENTEALEKYLQNPRNSHEMNYFIQTITSRENYITVLSRKDFKVTGWIRGVYDKGKAPNPTP